jgi:exopolyphosphatase/guanosine-5'-triphosphate,3'-diphosphate pyrophosphatase
VRVAAIDVGTNTVRLLVADETDNGLATVDRAREITRLGKGVDARRKLDPVQAKNTLDVIASFVERAREAKADKIRIAGTSALRDAEDGMDFAHTVGGRTGVMLDVLRGTDEGRLSFLGATSDLPNGTYMVCDIGGGSTELTVGREGPTATVSLDVGSVRLKERLLRDDPPTASQVQSVYSRIEAELTKTDFELMVTGKETLVGVAGTVTTLAALVLGLRTYDTDAVHHARLPVAEVSKTVERLRKMPVHEIRRIGVVEAGRADVITAGSLVLRFVMERWGYDECLVSENDILDGLALDLLR